MGLDLSITATGIVVLDKHGQVGWQEEVQTFSQNTDMFRYRVIWRCIRQAIEECKPKFILIENYSYGSPNQMARIGELSGIVKWQLSKLGKKWDVIPPKKLKKWATGNGNASKKDMLEACPLETKSHNLADAYWLARHAQEEYQAWVLAS